MSKHKPKSTRDEFMARKDKMCSVRLAAQYADQAGRHYAKDKITRLEAQMMIDAAVGSPWALFMAWCRHTWRTLSGAKRRMEEQFRRDEIERRAIADDVAEQLDPAMNEQAMLIEDDIDAETGRVSEQTLPRLGGAVMDIDAGYEPVKPKSKIILADR